MDSIKKGQLSPLGIDNRPRFGDNHISGCYDKIKPQHRIMQGDYATFSQGRIGRELE